MAKLVSLEQLKNTITGVWDKTKEKFLVSVEYEQSTQKLKTKTGKDAEVEVQLTDLVSKTNNNGEVSGETKFSNAYIKGSESIELINTAQLDKPSVNIAWYLSERLTIPANKVVTKIIVAVHDSNIVGGKINDIRISAVRKTGRIVIDDIVNKYTAKVFDCTDAGLGSATRAVEIQVNKKWEENVILAIQVPTMLWGPNNISTLNAAGEKGIPAIGKNVTEAWNSTSGRYCGIVRVMLEDISLKNLATKETTWKDLKHVTENDSLNILDYNSRVSGQWYGTGNDSSPSSNPDYSFVYVNVEPSQVYTVFRKVDDINRYFFLNKSNTKIDQTNGEKAPEQVGTWFKSTVVTGANLETAKMVVQFQHASNTSDSIMVFKGDYNPVGELAFIPYTGETPFVIDSKNVSLAYSSSDGSLTSTTVNKAIDELNKKIASADGTVKKVNGIEPLPDADGNVVLTLDSGLTDVKNALDGKATKVELALKIDKTEAERIYVKNDNTTVTGGRTDDDGKIVKLDGNGFISSTIIPKIALTEVVKYNGKTEALAGIDSGVIQNGDVVVLTGESNKIYMLANKDEPAVGGDTEENKFKAKFIELSLGDGTIKTIGSQPANGTGDIVLAFEDGTNTIELKANGQKITQLELMEDSDVQQIIGALPQ